jgi:D-lactate dehydrogenase (cytochrome)
MERMKKFRHAVPEAVNLTIDERRKTEPQITKLGTDLAVPDDCLERIIRLYRDGLSQAGLQSVMFGHIGNNHLHVNIIPANLEQYDAGKKLYLEWARAVVAMGGTVSAEHGIGKLKTEMLKIMYGEEGVREMLGVKRVFDPELRLNRGNLFG